MNIGGLLTRSFGTGPSAINKAESDALSSLRDRQAFRDEEEARRRKAVIEGIALGAGAPSGPFVGELGEMATVTVPPPVPQAPVPPAGISTAGLAQGASYVKPTGGVATPAGVAPATPAASTIAGAGNRFDDYQNTKQALSRSTARINQMTAELDQIPRKIGRVIPYSEGVQRIRQLEQELASERATQTKLTKEMITLAKPAAKPAATPATRVGVPPLLAKPAATNIIPDAVAPAIADLPAGQFANFTRAVMMAESGGDPKAVSSVGALGRMQVMPATLKAPGYGIRPAQDDSDAERERVGVEYLAAMTKEFNGNPVHILAAYNWGPGNTKKWIEQGADFAKLPKETQDYIPRVLRFFDKAAQPGTPTLGATSSTPSNTYVPAVAEAKLPDYSNAVPRLEFDLIQKMDQRKELQRQADVARQQGVPELYMQTVAQLRQLDRELVFMQGMVGLGDIVDNPVATQRLSQVMSYYRGQKPGYYILQPRSDGKYNEVVNGVIRQEGITLQEVIDKTRMVFDEAYAASVNATRAAQSEAAIKTFAELQILAAKSGFTINEKLVDRQAEAYIETLKGNNAYRQAVEVARINNQGKTVDPKFFNTAEGVTLMSVGNQLFKVLLQEDGKGGTVPGSEYLAPVTGGLMPTQ